MNRAQFDIIRSSVEKMLDQGARGRTFSMVRKLHEADIARLIDHLLPPMKRRLFSLITSEDIKLASAVISELDTETAVELLKGMSVEQITGILQEMSADDAANVMAEIPDELRDKIIDTMRTKDSEDIQELLQYPEDTAGRIMITDFFAVSENDSVQKVIKELHKKRDVETVFYIYVIGDYGHLLGVVSLRQLLLARPNTLIKNVMTTEVMSVTADTDQEEVARIVERYNLVAIPVVNDDNKLLGLVTVDDIIDIIREEATEDFMRLAGVGEEDISDRSTMKNVAGRAPWLFAAFIGGILAAIVISIYDNVLKTVIMLAYFIPVIAGMGGNVGTQCATIMVRGLALGKVGMTRSWRLVLKEIRIALVLGISYGILLGVVAFFFGKESLMVGLLVGISFLLSIVIAATVGSTIPLILNRAGVDPAIATGPFVTTSIDVIGVSIYLSLASLLLM